MKVVFFSVLSCTPALNLYYKRKYLLKIISLHREKDQTKNFSPFLCKRPFEHRKKFLKSNQFHLKGLHFKPLQVALSARYGEKAGIALKQEILQMRIWNPVKDLDGAFSC